MCILAAGERPSPAPPLGCGGSGRGSRSRSVSTRTRREPSPAARGCRRALVERRRHDRRREARSARSGSTITTTSRRRSVQQAVFSAPGRTGAARRAAVSSTPARPTDDTFRHSCRTRGHGAVAGSFTVSPGIRHGAPGARSRLPRQHCRHRDVPPLDRYPATWRAFVPADRLLIETDAPYLARCRFGEAQRAGVGRAGGLCGLRASRGFARGNSANSGGRSVGSNRGSG